MIFRETVMISTLEFKPDKIKIITEAGGNSRPSFIYKEEKDYEQ